MRKILNYLKFASKNKLRFTRQLESLDCGPTCLKMIAGYHGRDISLDYLRRVCKTAKLGTSLKGMSEGARMINMESMSLELSLPDLKKLASYPCVLFWRKSHFVILQGIIPKQSFFFKLFSTEEKFIIADPSFGIIKLGLPDFTNNWCKEANGNGIALFFEPNENFADDKEPEIPANNPQSYTNKVWELVSQYKFGLLKVFIGMILSGALILTFPLLTQKLIDVGIHYKSPAYIELILLTQLFIFIGASVIDSIKSWILLFIGTKIEINLTSRFLSKIMKLPMFYFDSKLAGDLMQRISDNNRIELFIKTYLLEFIISSINLLVLMGILIFYDLKVFYVYLFGTVLSVGWIAVFMRKRELLDYRRFDIASEGTDNLIETIVSMPEIKLNNAQNEKKKSWEKIQIRMFDINIRILSVQQYQNIGNNVIVQIKNVLVTFLIANYVVEGTMTLGVMLGVSVILGQLTGPFNQIVSFFQFYQDSRISFSRLGEIHKREEEDANKDVLRKEVAPADIVIKNLKFSYTESYDDLIFDNLNLSIPKGQTTAIVGTSGSGKTTLLKLLMKFYQPLEGEILIGGFPLSRIDSDYWRSKCGAVLQEGYIFSETVANNITMRNADAYNSDQLAKIKYTTDLTNITDFVESLPMGFKTKIGGNGIGISTGQKQRILIARALYKNPEILFLDEATSSLDAKNEKVIIENLNSFFTNKTVVVVAHRLSTVKNAHNIVVLETGKIIEQGTHEELIKQKGTYYQLIKNQLELGD
ncbi:peptidase domain-containing ABC transporter [Emticicia sp. TH156]|uniref:peptidase domain-containing ABC transporter n=1 Tax=Emticicia sp. TH156 TaxID=2067454 RepID=UPI000C792790|nr:peptidase domain-containing ABC transporter [Emticicia sp. TH156]PLK46108.1 ABC transporter ATP-binding protein [Emticicia sp. TH156]